MITVNNFEIQNNGEQLAIDVQTESGSLITSILLWNMNNFKDYTKAINLDYKLTNVNNTESFIVTAEELELGSFTDVWFIEIQSDYIPVDNCGEFLDPALAITYNLSPYYKCLLNEFLKEQKSKSSCKTCDYEISDLVLSISLMIDIIEKAIEEGYYLQAIETLEKVKKFCSITKCTNCERVECSSCSKFKQT